MISRIALLAIVVLWASCSPKSEYTNAIPKNAAGVVSFDFKQMYAKSGLTAEHIKRLMTLMNEMMKDGVNAENRKNLEMLLSNPSESGLSLTDDVYLFLTPGSKVVGVVAKVADESKVENLMKMRLHDGTTPELKSESNCRWALVGNALCAFNSTTFLMMSPTKGAAIDHKETVLYLMRQDANESFTSTPEFSKLQDADGDIAAITGMAMMPESMTMQMRMGLPADLSMKDLKGFYNLSFEKGKIVIDGESLIADKKVKGYLEEQWECLSPIKGSYLECYPAATPIWAGVRMDGGKVYELLCQHPAIGQELKEVSQTVDVKGIFEAIDGDVAFGLTSLANGDLIAYADVKGSEFMQTFEDLRAMLEQGGSRMMKLTPTGENQYELRVNAILRLWFGVKDEVLYFSTNKQLADEAGRRYGVSLANTPWADKVDDNHSFTVFNAGQIVEGLKANPLVSYMMRSMKKETATVFAVLSAVDYITSGASDWDENHTEIVMKDKETNVLELLARGLDKL